MTRWTTEFIAQQVVMFGLWGVTLWMGWITVREMLEEWDD